jgi:hypothetical protein
MKKFGEETPGYTDKMGIKLRNILENASCEDWW